MTNEERALLLTVGRILRARINENRINQNDQDDIVALNEALAPFGPSEGHPTNEKGEQL